MSDPERERVLEYLDEDSRVIDAATGEVLRTVSPPPRFTETLAPGRYEVSPPGLED